VRLAALLAALAATALLAAPAAAQTPGPVPGVPALPDASKLGLGNGLRHCSEAPPQPALPAVDARGVAADAPNPLTGLQFFVDPAEPAWQQWASLRRGGLQADADLVWKIASQPKFRWFGRWTRPNMTKKVREYLNCVHVLQPGAVPEMVVMRAQAKGCGKGYGGGGPAEDARTRAWYREFAGAIGDERVVIAFEPDSLGTIDCQRKARRAARYELLRYGVDVLSRLPNATIYLEAGASDWEPAGRTAKQLRLIGVSKVRGFMLNATHYDWTASNIQHGLDISRRVGGKHFIVSTSFNGRGAVHYRRYSGRHRWRTINVWCHPLMRGLGPAPTTDTVRPDRVDAYMWIGRPGYSGGGCNGGPLPVGAWWARRALMFGKYATDWVRPPRGTRYGHYRAYSLRALGG